MKRLARLEQSGMRIGLERLESGACRADPHRVQIRREVREGMNPTAAFAGAPDPEAAARQLIAAMQSS